MHVAPVIKLVEAVTAKRWLATDLSLIMVMLHVSRLRMLKLDTDDLIRRIASLEKQGVTNRGKQAELLGMSRSTYMRQLRKQGLTQGYLSHTQWIPWGPLKPEHHDSLQYRYLVMLSTAAQHVETNEAYTRSSAIGWALELVEAGQDLTYDYDRGWILITADPSDWHMKRLYDAAQAFVTPTSL